MAMFLYGVLFYENNSDSCARAVQDVVSCTGCLYEWAIIFKQVETYVTMLQNN